MNILSLFDGMSCGQQALNRLGIKPTNYFASEIDKYAIQVTMANFPNTIQLGSVTLVDVSKLPKIDLLIGGSPCTDFSFSGKRKGMSTKDSIEILTLEHYLELKSQNFEFEGQSYLFWEYMRILTDIKKTNPDVKFLLENVIMGAKWQKTLATAIGINPIEINSSLLSAQNRRRLYFTNIGAEPDGLFGDLKCMIKQPKNKGILLKDILESEVDEKYYLSDKALEYLNRDSMNSRFVQNQNDDKGGCITANYQKGIPYNAICVASRGRNPENPKSRQSGLPTEQQLEPRNDGKTICLTSVQKDNLIVHNMMPRSSKSGKGGTGHLTRRDGKTYCLDTGNTNAVEKDYRIRRLTPIECCRLQTVSDDYFHKDGKQIVSDTQIYKQLGNGWTVDVIAHIFSYLKA